MLLEARVAHRVTEAEAAQLSRQVYGLEASARTLPGEYDDNFQLTTADGRAFVLKVMHPAREPSFIDMQCQALVHLAESAPQLPLRVCCQIAAASFFRKSPARMVRSGWFGCCVF